VDSKNPGGEGKNIMLTKQKKNQANVL